MAEKKREERPKTNLKALTRVKTTPKAARTIRPAAPPSVTKPAAAVETPANKTLLNITNRSVIGGAVGTPSSASKKPVFDLKASLAKPLGYKPHTGKLQEWGKKVKNIIYHMLFGGKNMKRGREKGKMYIKKEERGKKRVRKRKKGERKRKKGRKEERGNEKRKMEVKG